MTAWIKIVCDRDGCDASIMELNGPVYRDGWQVYRLKNGRLQHRCPDHNVRGR